MRLLANATAIENTLRALLEEAQGIRWAVAWASTKAPLFEALKARRDRILQLTVGTHFNQTDPDFIEEFREHPAARFVLDSSGVFHPKIYVFDCGDGWRAVVGSSNFTGAGLSTNQEVAVLVSHEDVDGSQFLEDAMDALAKFQRMGAVVSAEELLRYRQRFDSAEVSAAKEVMSGGESRLLLAKTLQVQSSWFLESGGSHGISLGADVRRALQLDTHSPKPTCRIFHEGRLLESGSLNPRNSGRLTGTTTLLENLGLKKHHAKRVSVTLRVLEDNDGVRLEFSRAT